MVYRDHHMLCLLCGVALERRKYRAYASYACQQCGAAWVHHAHLDNMLALMVPAGVDRPQLVRRPSHHDDPVRHCPECDRPMAQWMVGADRIDQCDTHGLWFDPGELARVLFTSSQTP